jgi:hypothetical protein
MLSASFPSRHGVFIERITKTRRQSTVHIERTGGTASGARHGASLAAKWASNLD